MGRMLLLFLLCITIKPYASTQFKAGSQVKFTYFDVYDTPFLPHSFFQYHGFIYAGFQTSKYFGYTQFTFSVTPGVLFYIDEDEKESVLGSRGKLDKVVPSFFFRTAYFSVDTLTTTVAIGKRPLLWGIGNLRQFSFFLNKEFSEEVLGYYNAEIKIRHEKFLFSFGGAADTTSLDLLIEPTWYAPWFYFRYDHKKFTLLTSINMFISDKYGIDAKAAIDLQFFLPKGFQFYMSFAHYFIYHDSVGKVDEIRFLSGLSFEYMKGLNFMLVPSLEYVFEDGDNILSIGTMVKLHSTFSVLLYSSTIFKKEKTVDPSLIFRATWGPNSILSIQFEYQYYFSSEQKDFPIRNNVSMRVRWEI